MTFDPNKPVQTRDGKKARILCTDFKNKNCRIAAAVTTSDDGEGLIIYYDNGRYLGNGESTLDLVNIPEEKIIKMMLCPPINKVAWVWVKVTIRDNKVVKIELD